MSKEIVLFKSEERKDLVSVAAFLSQLAEKLAENQVILRQGEEEITLIIPDQVVLELKVEEEEKRRGKKHTFEIEIEWMEGEAANSSVALG
jgi:amphi-Trp domain-containing protein